jgi:chromosome segregation ATPase
MQAVGQQGQVEEAKSHQQQWDNDAVLLRTRELEQKAQTQQAKLTELQQQALRQSATQKDQMSQLELQLREATQARQGWEKQRDQAQADLAKLAAHKLVVAGTQAENLVSLKQERDEFKTLYEHMLAREVSVQTHIDTLRRAEEEMKLRLEDLQQRYTKDTEALQKHMGQQIELGKLPPNERESNLLERLHRMEALLATQKEATQETAETAERALDRLQVPAREEDLIQQYLKQVKELEQQDNSITKLKLETRKLSQQTAEALQSCNRCTDGYACQ